MTDSTAAHAVALRSFAQSEALLARALEVIPLGTQTFSKSHVQYPRGAAPFFVERAQGSRVWDVDGNEYVDFVNALAAVTLGHCDADVSAAVRAQLEQGTIFSLPHRLEVEVAELIVDMVPCAEQVRFGKNGSDATSGAIRAARAYTGRDRVAVCGYHGWQDWYIGSTTRNKGIPRAVCELTHGFAYNSVDSLAQLLATHPGEFAAVILEPMNVVQPAPGFLAGVKQLCRDHGVVLVFDETITGFRFANGGAQELFGVTPDLATFGKGLANGYPLSAVAGRADIMREFEDVFFSFTMGGETLSLAAALATMKKLREENVVSKVRQRGETLQRGVAAAIERHGCGEFLASGGDPTWSFLIFKDAGDISLYTIKTLWMQETLARGIMSVGTHNLSYAHDDADIERVLAVYDEIFPMLRDAVERCAFDEYLRCAPLEPLFKVR
ncbi:MAG: aminotransferase class III-fold pyridoxal phosphate-dependent enzyme [Gammaproteobacteria bacterium]